MMYLFMISVLCYTISYWIYLYDSCYTSRTYIVMQILGWISVFASLMSNNLIYIIFITILSIIINNINIRYSVIVIILFVIYQILFAIH